MTKAVFLDRDGVINRKPSEGDYVTRLEDFHVLPGVVESIAQLNHAGFCVIVVTNQRCIAKGLMTVADLERMHRQMSESLARAGAIINGIYYCPHEMEPTCSCRKPAPGMLLDAALSRGIELSASWMIGDSDIDVEAGRNAGCKTARLSAPNEAANEPGSCADPSSAADIVARSLFDAVRQILQWEGVAVSSFTAAPATQN
ncbi:MAG TPA: HAD family hydrolase [Terriglobales bacterium]|jgi:D-glycero-D-manno-heptose 1,7-bisphosphate phosphatase|nr:HAD family hydrolase [Terriglobales bacterium]